MSPPSFPRTENFPRVPPPCPSRTRPSPRGLTPEWAAPGGRRRGGPRHPQEPGPWARQPGSPLALGSRCSPLDLAATAKRNKRRVFSIRWLTLLKSTSSARVTREQGARGPNLTSDTPPAPRPQQVSDLTAPHCPTGTRSRPTASLGSPCSALGPAPTDPGVEPAPHLPTAPEGSALTPGKNQRPGSRALLPSPGPWGLALWPPTSPRPAVLTFPEGRPCLIPAHRPQDGTPSPAVPFL